MRDNLVTTLTARGQTTVPAKLRKAGKLKSGQRLHWRQLSPFEFLVSVEGLQETPSAMAALGYARKFKHGYRSTREALGEIRASGRK